jgi:pyrimidine-nucleoside phosphorylase
MRALNPVELIVRKRDGGRLTAGEIEGLIASYLAGDVLDYQLSAFLMACFFRGLDRDETVALTQAMLHSGKVLDLRSVTGPKIDKHSTGGVGDKISLCLAPLVAACGVAAPMIAGRGLGHTGGTLDKLEVIPGYRVALDGRAFERVLRGAGAAIVGQTAELAPADRRIYALRDVTGTVECIPLIVASILSKKLAVAADGLVLDVKVGRGAFMKDRKQARTLCRALVDVGRRAGRKVVALLTDMHSPIGRTVGNALETREAIEVLRDGGPADTRELTLALGVEMLRLAGVAKTPRAARALMEAKLSNGEALARFRKMVELQGGDVRAVDDPSRLPRAKVRLPVTAKRAGVVVSIDALELGLVGVELGAGRTRADQAVDPGAGIEIERGVGERVKAGEIVAYVSGASRANVRGQLERVQAAFEMGARAPKRKLVLERVT